MFKTFKKLYQAKLASPRGLYRLLASVLRSKTNLMALLDFAARTYPKEIAIIEGSRQISYAELYQETLQLAAQLQKQYQLNKGQKVGLLCKNHIPFVQSLFALSMLGVDVYLLNVAMNSDQLEHLLERHQFRAIIHDEQGAVLLAQSSFDHLQIHSHTPCQNAIIELAKRPIPKNFTLKKSSAGKLVILTGGTTGHFKTAVRKPSLFTFLNPFFALLNQLNLGSYRSVFIITPIYHGFGVAALLISMILGVKIILAQQFKAEMASQLMRQHQVEVLVLVPIMLQRLLQQDLKNFQYNKVILSGGAALNPTLVKQTSRRLPNQLANLYGTSEAGFCVMATGKDLQDFPTTIGKKIKGVEIKILDKNKQEVPSSKVGMLCVKSSWTMTNKADQWIETGDLAYMDNKGYCFLCGRIDDLVISGGVNVYPVELEHILLQHNAIFQAAVIGIPDVEYGQRLKAFISLQPKAQLNTLALKEWLKEKATGPQKPKEIVFLEQIPLTALGKIDKKKLS
ncbi:MAG: Acyl-CoA synthetase (AMP-forming)/AMP-acid ligase II [uncultured Aureispira sp.]|uniref:Acyl-CoA synthetase (AMP-forming)/AMP-acid ligase II n=1 Tax=uncultured Aureispira sp. TaxID=1331704 RepID=A0A6S6ULE2_9BACT|nr:MAG: Acyl-CoA synthetase (AMP-forming)/AMP-acid ligase II [uncultured Aureispira sp.]